MRVEEDNLIKVIFIGDIVGRAGRNAVKAVLPELANDVDLVIANAENSSGGFGLTDSVYKELRKLGVDLFTGGNHIWDKPDVKRQRDKFSLLATPANLSKEDSCITCSFKGSDIALINLAGRVFMPDGADDPFAVFDRLYEKHCENRIVIVDFHAEATSEKLAFAEYTAGRASAVIGTHTHVQTADERILRNGTFFISDAGSCCALHSILGMTVESSLARFISPEKQRMQVEMKGPLVFNGVKFSIDALSGKVTEFERINRLVGQ